MENSSRRKFIKNTGIGLFGALLAPNLATPNLLALLPKPLKISGHLWVYASKFPPHWDCTPILESVFSDFKYAGMDGVELMEGQLRHNDSVPRIKGYINKYNLLVTGSSYGVGFGMWDKSQTETILADINLVVPRLAAVGGRRLGISVGSKPTGLKSASDLDTQAEVLLKIKKICEENGIEPNLHNHTYEVENNLHDLKGTLARIPDFKLGPDINWLLRADIDPLSFIETYGKQIVYLHLRDQYANGVWTEYLGQGETDYKAIGLALKKQQFNGEVAIELAFPENFTPQYELRKSWKKSRQFVKKTFV